MSKLERQAAALKALGRIEGFKAERLAEVTEATAAAGSPINASSRSWVACLARRSS